VLLKYRVAAADAKKAAPPISEEQVQQLVARTIQDLKPQNVSVIMAPVAPPPLIENGPGDVEVLGMRMAADSVRTFQAILGFGVLVILGLVGYIVFLKSRELGRPSRSRTRTEG
jgi:type III secretory pathway lipoprotein EscJ